MALKPDFSVSRVSWFKLGADSLVLSFALLLRWDVTVNEFEI